MSGCVRRDLDRHWRDLEEVLIKDGKKRAALERLMDFVACCEDLTKMHRQITVFDGTSG